MSNLTETQIAQLKTVLPHHINDNRKIHRQAVRLESGPTLMGDFNSIHIYADGTFKPILRPMDSMTEEEKREYGELMAVTRNMELYDTPASVLYCLQNHFDIFDLIWQGLALEKK